MPNHITNIIRFTGEPDDIVRLLKQIAYDDSSEQDILSGVHSIDFNKIISQPEDIGDGWYDWRVAHWGIIKQISERSNVKGRSVECINVIVEGDVANTVFGKINFHIKVALKVISSES